MVHFRIITKENLRDILHLEVHEEQKDQVASNAASIAQGHYYEEAYFRAIYHEDTPVGFFMLYIDVPKTDYQVWRFMIDQKHQGKGYGRAALIQIIEYMKGLPDIKEIRLTYVPKKERGANLFYEKIGFIDTGIDKKGEIVMRYPIE